jgi:hypothetical protein
MRNQQIQQNNKPHRNRFTILHSEDDSFFSTFDLVVIRSAVKAGSFRCNRFGKQAAKHLAHAQPSNFAFCNVNSGIKKKDFFVFTRFFGAAGLNSSLKAGAAFRSKWYLTIKMQQSPQVCLILLYQRRHHLPISQGCL